MNNLTILKTPIPKFRPYRTVSIDIAGISGHSNIGTLMISGSSAEIRWMPTIAAPEPILSIVSKTASELTSEAKLSKEKAWDDLKQLLAKWDAMGDVADDLDDEWLDNLRASSDRWLDEIYDSDADE